MNNSDIIAALSLALTAIIFLMQSDDSILKTKISKRDKIIIIIATVSIVLLSNYKVFDRLKINFYFTIKDLFLTPPEWALLIFLFLIAVGLKRLLTPKIFNNNPKVLMAILQKYRAEKKMVKLESLILQMMQLPDFEETYAEQLDDIIFNDHHLIEYFSSNYPNLVVEFTRRYPDATLNRGEHLFYILNGLFADKSNPIFSEIRRYAKEPVKGDCFIDWKYSSKEFSFAPLMNYETALSLIHWLSEILLSFPSRLKEDVSFFLSQHKTQTATNNGTLFEEEHILASLSRDTVFNALQLFRILLIEISFTDKRIRHVIDRILLMQYSSWDFIEENTSLTEGVQLGNDRYSINEYFLKYVFETYCMLFVINKRIGYSISVNVDNDEDIGWCMKQLFFKLDSLWKSKRICEDSKKYFVNRLIELYFDLPEFFSGEYLANTEDTILYYFKTSLSDAPFGDPATFLILFRNVCEHREFYRQNNEHSVNQARAAKLHQYLLPYTQDLDWRICYK